MNKTPPLFSQRALVRAALLGVALFIAFGIAAGGLWALGSALGLGNAASFLLAACAAPVLVGGVVLLWFLSLPLERRQSLLGTVPQPPERDREE